MNAIYTEKLRQDCLYVLFLSKKCPHSEEIKKRIDDVSDFGKFLTIMEIESLLREGEKLPKYVKGTPTLVIQHKQTGQVMPPVEGDAVFEWVRDLIKPKAGGAGTGGAGADDSGGVSIGAVNRVRFDPSKIKQGNLDPGQFQIPTEGKSKGNSDLDAKLKEMAEDARSQWSRK